jgi:hypothetical protein
MTLFDIALLSFCSGYLIGLLTDEIIDFFERRKPKI